LTNISAPKTILPGRRTITREIAGADNNCHAARAESHVLRSTASDAYQKRLPAAMAIQANVTSTAKGHAESKEQPSRRQPRPARRRTGDENPRHWVSEDPVRIAEKSTLALFDH
jgi:hypothetical protein